MGNMERDEPLSPAGRLFLQPETNQIINCLIGVEKSIDVDAIKAVINDSVLLKHPRFCSLMVKDSCGREYWRRTEVDVDRHLIVFDKPLSDEYGSISDEDTVNEYAADLSVSSPLSTDKPLWEIHLLMAHRCIVFRLHHALGDGISLMSMLLSCCRRADDPMQQPTAGGLGTSSTPRRRLSLWTLMKVVWYTLVYVLEFILRALWLKDKKTVLSGGAGVELWPRKLATARFRLDDMKTVKKAIANATINDVLFGVLSCGVSRYLDIRSPKALGEGLQLTGAAMVNLRPQAGLQDISKLMNNDSGTRWGNKFGMMLLPIYYHKGDSNPIQFLKSAKSMIDKKKLSLEAPCSYKIGDFVMSFFGANVTFCSTKLTPSFQLASILNYRILCNTTFTISNVIGPREDITIGGNPATYIRASSTSLPHAITMHMVSYGERADMQVLVAKDLIPDPQVLVKCFEDALLEMKDAAEAATKT